VTRRDANRSSSRALRLVRATATDFNLSPLQMARSWQFSFGRFFVTRHKYYYVGRANHSLDSTT
jgi:hypothetical protein